MLKWYLGYVSNESLEEVKPSYFCTLGSAVTLGGYATLGSIGKKIFFCCFLPEKTSQLK